MLSGNNQFMELLKMSFFLNINNNDYTNFNTLFVLILSLFFTNQVIIDYFFNIARNYSALFNNKKTIILEGKRCFKTADYNTRSDQLFSDRFKAVWYYSINSITNNNTIYEIKEYSESCNIYDEYGDTQCHRSPNAGAKEYASMMIHVVVLDSVNAYLFCQIYSNSRGLCGVEGEIHKGL